MTAKTGDRVGKVANTTWAKVRDANHPGMCRTPAMNRPVQNVNSARAARPCSEQDAPLCPTSHHHQRKAKQHPDLEFHDQRLRGPNSWVVSLPSSSPPVLTKGKTQHKGHFSSITKFDYFTPNETWQFCQEKLH